MIREFEVLVAAASPENRSALTKVLCGMGLRPSISSSVKEVRAILSTKPVSDRKSTRLNSSHIQKSRMPSSA